MWTPDGSSVISWWKEDEPSRSSLRLQGWAVHVDSCPNYYLKAINLDLYSYSPAYWHYSGCWESLLDYGLEYYMHSSPTLPTPCSWPTCAPHCSWARCPLSGLAADLPALGHLDQCFSDHVAARTGCPSCWTKHQVKTDYLSYHFQFSFWQPLPRRPILTFDIGRRVCFSSVWYCLWCWFPDIWLLCWFHLCFWQTYWAGHLRRRLRCPNGFPRLFAWSFRNSPVFLLELPGRSLTLLALRVPCALHARVGVRHRHVVSNSGFCWKAVLYLG